MPRARNSSGVSWPNSRHIPAAPSASWKKWTRFCTRQGATVNSQTSISEILALLDALKAAVRDFAAREEKLESAFRVQSAAASEAFASRNQAQAAASAENE